LGCMMSENITYLEFLKRNPSITVVPAIFIMLLVKDPIAIVFMMAIYVLVLVVIGFIRSDNGDQR